MAQLGYEEALAGVAAALPFGINPSLEGIAALCHALRRPEEAFRVVQVTGTNGKTSTARLTEALLRAHGVRTALYTSPELERYPERFEVAGRVATDEDVARALSAVLEAAEVLRPGRSGTPAGFTEFELTTAAALWLFAHSGVEVAVLEVGMGGRWDATSVASPAVAVITGVGLDHTAILGDTHEAIAAEKAAIIRSGSVAVLGPGTRETEDIFVEAARSAGAPVRRVREGLGAGEGSEAVDVGYELVSTPQEPRGTTVLDVRGAEGFYPALALRAPAYQAANVATAVAAAEATLGRTLDVAAAREALLQAALPGRFEVVSGDPLVVVDGSHNPQAAAVLADSIAAAWSDPSRRPVVLVGVLADKDAAGIVAALAPAASRLVACAPASPRALEAAELAAVACRVTGSAFEYHETLQEALCALLGDAEVRAGGLVVTGSLTTAGQARSALRDGSAT